MRIACLGGRCATSLWRIGTVPGYNAIEHCDTEENNNSPPTGLLGEADGLGGGFDQKVRWRNCLGVSIVSAWSRLRDDGKLGWFLGLREILGDVMRFPNQCGMETNSFNDGGMIREQEFRLVFSRRDGREVASFTSMIKNACQQGLGGSQHLGGVWPVIRFQ